MRGQTVQLYQPIELFTETCCSCGVLYGITTQFKNERVKDHNWFYCPNGHYQRYSHESKAEENARLLREEQARHQRTLERANAEREAKEKAERKLKRVSNGVCPDCNRSFLNLAKHMACAHKKASGKLRPQYANEFERAKAKATKAHR